MNKSYSGSITLGELLDEIVQQTGQPIEDVRGLRVLVNDRVNELLDRRVESVEVKDGIVTLDLWKPAV